MKRQGFTLIELLVVIAIIGLLSTLAVVALGSARQKARDAKRLSDLKQVQTALELYYTDNSGYPAAATAVTLGAGTEACLNASGFAATGCPNAYMGVIPAAPTPGVDSYQSTAATTYTIAATLEGTVNGMSGNIQANPSGIIDVAG